MPAHVSEKNTHKQTAEVNSPFAITLNSKRLSGYEWKPTFDASKFVLLNRRFVTSRRLMGGGGKVVFRFRPLTKGHHAIRFDLIRPWETKPAAQERFDLTVV